MTRRSITTVLGSLLVGLVLIINAPAVAAADQGGGGSTRLPVIAEGQCDDEMLCLSMYAPVANVATFSVASVGQPVEVQTVDYRFVEQNTITLPSANGAIIAPGVVSREQQRFIEENTITLPSVGAEIFATGGLMTSQGQSIAMNAVLPQSLAQTYMEDLMPSDPSTPR